MIFVEQAIAALNQRELEQANLNAIPIGLVGEYLARTKGDQNTSSEDFNPIGRHLYQLEAKDQIDPEAARTFLQLSAEQQIPAWVIVQVDIKQMRAAAR